MLILSKCFQLNHTFSLCPINILLSGPCRAADWWRAGKGETVSSTVKHQRSLYPDGYQGKIEFITFTPDIGFHITFSLKCWPSWCSWWNMSIWKAWRSTTLNHWIRKALFGLLCGTPTTTPSCRTPTTGQVSTLLPRNNSNQISHCLLSQFFIFNITKVSVEVF